MHDGRILAADDVVYLAAFDTGRMIGLEDGRDGVPRAIPPSYATATDARGWWDGYKAGYLEAKFGGQSK